MDGQYVAYTFFRVDPAWRRLPVEERAAGEGRVRRGASRTSRRASTRSAPTRRPASGPRPTSSSGRSRRATRTSASSARRSTRRRSPAGSRRRTRTSRRRRRRSTPRRAARARSSPKGSPYLVVYPFVKVRPWYALPEERPAARDGRAHPHRPRGVPDDPQPHDLLVRDRRPGVHDGVRVRRAGRLHAPDAAAARHRGVALHRARHADLRRPARRDPRGARPPRRRCRSLSKTTVRRVTAPRSCSSSMRPVPPCDQANAAATWCSSFSWIPSSWIVSVGGCSA